MTVRPAATTATAGLLGEMETIEITVPLMLYIRTALAAGYSMRAALAAFRGAGGAIRTDYFAELWRGEQARRAGA